MTWPRRPGARRSLPSTLPSGRSWPRFSIVTPSLNQGAFIEETILSVLNQEYPNVEHIVIDGGSTDTTGDVLDRYRSRLASVVSEADRGQGHAINKGMARATGDILTWLNSDDRLAPGALAAIAMAFDSGDADLVAGICELWRDGQLVERHLTSCEDGPIPLEDLLDLDGCWNAGQFFFQPEVFFTRDLWSRAGGQLNEHVRFSMDYELWLRFAAAGARLKVIGRSVAQFRLHDLQKTADPRDFQAELPCVRQQFLEAHDLRLAERPPANEPIRPARIVFVNDIGFQYGAGIAHGRLAAAATMAGHDVISITCGAAIRSSPPAREEQDGLLQRIEAARPDVVIVGNLHAAGLSASFLEMIASRWPTAFVAHDLWIVTGRCAYTAGCEKFRSRCDETCPTPNEYPVLAPHLIGPEWDAKRRLMASRHAPLILANSEWTRTQIERAMSDGTRTEVRVEAITLGAPDEFTPLDKEQSRRLLGLPRDPFLVLLSATSLSDPRKGQVQLLEALAQLKLPDVELVLVGSGAQVDIPGMRVHHFRYLADIDLLAMVYSAADIFVGPSLEESLGQVFFEAAACGLPSVAYSVGGVPEALKDGVTGLLANAITADALAETIRRLHDASDLRQALSTWGRLDFQNERTLERAYHRLHGALRRSLHDGERVLGRKIRLRTLAAAGTDDESEIWRAIAGFGPWEGPFPDLRLPRCRWLEHLSGTLHLKTPESGLHTVTLRLRNIAPNQRLRVTCREVEVFSGSVPITHGLDEDWVLNLDVELEAPHTLVTLETASGYEAPEGRSLMILVCGVQIGSRGSRPNRRLRERVFGWLSKGTQ